MCKQEGFTILELLVIISVLVIIIGISIPRMKGMQDTAKKLQVKSDLKTLQTAVESYFMMNKDYPPGPAILNLQSAYLMNTTPQLISSILYDAYHSSQEYGYGKTGQYYVICSAGPNLVNEVVAIDSNGNLSYASGSVGDDICLSNGPTSSVNY